MREVYVCQQQMMLTCISWVVHYDLGWIKVVGAKVPLYWSFHDRARLKPDGTRWRMGGEVKGKLVNGVGTQYSHTTSECGVSSITTADAHTLAAGSQLNWHPCRLKWTRPFQRKIKSGCCACAITFQTHYNTCLLSFLIEIQWTCCLRSKSWSGSKERTWFLRPPY